MTERHPEARRLHSLGYKLVELHAMSKRPLGEGWNLAPIAGIRDDAHGHGLLLAVNALCSVDPDNEPLARFGLARCGFDLDTVMRAGVRTTSTRPGSGGRVTFRAPGAAPLRWIKFASRSAGTLLELRASSPNLQDSLPGTVYLSKDGSGPWRQDYATDRRLDDAPEAPADLVAWWARMSADVEFLRAQQRVFVGPDAILAVSSADGGSLAFPSPLRATFNGRTDVPPILARHGYTKHGDRWAPSTASGAPAVRAVPERDGLWHSDHASDPLSGTFDAWAAFVVLDHEQDLDAAESAFRATLDASAADGFDDVPEAPEADAKDDTKPPRYRLSSVSELRNAPPLRWLVKGVLPAQGVAAIYGPSASGKSFLALDAAVAIASGETWFDHRVVDQTAVIYLGLEGEAGIAQRVAALDEYRLGLLPEGLQFILRQSFALTNPQDVSDLAKVLPKFCVLFVDTLNQAAPGADENSSQDMSRILAGAKALQRATGGLVVLIHHTGKDASRGLRGHSSLFAALDAAIEVEREGDVRRWRMAKAKDGSDDGVHQFRLVRVDLGTDSDGDSLSSCVVESGALIPMAAPKLNPTEALALEALRRLCKGATDKPSPSVTEMAVPLAAWRDAFYDARGNANTASNRQAFLRVRAALVQARVVAELEGSRYAVLDF